MRAVQRWSWPLWATLLVALASCAERSAPPTDRPEAETNPFTDAAGLRFDVVIDTPPPQDIPPPDLPVVTGAVCPDDRFCPRGQRCIGGRCALDPCDTRENVCGASVCSARCVPLRDPCDGVRCGARETCFNGRCIAGCFAAPCNGVACASGEFCNNASGR